MKLTPRDAFIGNIVPARSSKPVTYCFYNMEKFKYLIGPDAHNALLRENISNPQSLLTTSVKTIREITGLPLVQVNQAIQELSQEIIKNKCHPANEIESWGHISTGCPKLDSILLGGLSMNGITELHGCSGVGKTQFCLQLSLQTQLLKDLEVIYISTEDVFPSKRLKQLADSYRAKHNLYINFEDHIYLEHMADCVQLKKCLQFQLPHFMTRKNVVLLIIDSIAGIYRGDTENPNYVSRSREFNVICKTLNCLQDKYHCAILIVNQVTENLTTGMTEPCLGLSWANNVTSRFCLTRNKMDVARNFEIIFAPDLCPATTRLIITPEGLIDA